MKLISLFLFLFLMLVYPVYAEVTSCFSGSTSDEFVSWDSSGRTDPCYRTAIKSAYEAGQVNECIHSCPQYCCNANDPGSSSQTAAQDYLNCEVVLDNINKRECGSDNPTLFQECGESCGTACFVITNELLGDPCGQILSQCSTVEKNEYSFMGVVFLAVLFVLAIIRFRKYFMMMLLLLALGCQPQTAQEALEDGNYQEAKDLYTSSDTTEKEYGILLADMGLLSESFAMASNKEASWYAVWENMEAVAIRSNRLAGSNISIELSYPLKAADFFNIRVDGKWDRTEAALVSAVSNYLLLWESVYSSLLYNKSLNLGRLETTLDSLSYAAFLYSRGEGNLVSILSFNNGYISSGDLIKLPNIKDLYVLGKSYTTFINTLDNLQVQIPGTVKIDVDYITELFQSEEWTDLTRISYWLYDAGVISKPLCGSVMLDNNRLYNGYFEPVSKYLPIQVGDRVVIDDPSFGGALYIDGKLATYQSLMSLMYCVGMVDFKTSAWVKRLSPPIWVEPRQ